MSNNSRRQILSLVVLIGVVVEPGMDAMDTRMISNIAFPTFNFSSRIAVTFLILSGSALCCHEVHRLSKDEAIWFDSRNCGGIRATGHRTFICFLIHF